jgi:hypothetical protein
MSQKTYPIPNTIKKPPQTNKQNRKPLSGVEAKAKAGQYPEARCQ